MKSQSSWQSSMLHIPFERAIVGFDLRKATSLNQLFLTSYDENARFESLMEMNEQLLSAMNLFVLDPTDIPSIQLPLDARVVAFDLPVEYLRHQASGSVSVPPKMQMDVLLGAWEFTGFDVVDPLTQSSAFSQLTMSPDNHKTRTPEGAFGRNNYGLVGTHDAAVKAATFFDAAIPEHSPFVPCGIWLKN